MRLHRLLGIIMLLDSRGIMKAGNLAKILETSERTIYRDIDILCEAGLPITSTQGPNGGYSFMEDYRINSNVLESNDIVNLLFSSMGIGVEKNTETAQKLKNAVIKLENSLGEEHRKEIATAKEKFFIDSDPWWGKKTENKYVDVIKKSVLQLKKIKIHYEKYTDEVSERIIKPYGVVVKNSQWYVIGFCELKNDIRIFKCSRIQEIEVLEDTFSMPDNFYLEDFWRKSKQQFVESTTYTNEHNAYVVKIKLQGEKKKLLQGFYIHSSSQVKEEWVYDIDMLSFETACNIIFPLSDSVEVLKPIELREYILIKTNKILNLYNYK